MKKTLLTLVFTSCSFAQGITAHLFSPANYPIEKNRNDFVMRQYSCILNQDAPPPPEFLQWKFDPNTPTPVEDFFRSMFRMSTMDNQHFALSLYVCALHRDPSAGDYNNVVSALAWGISRDQMIQQVLTSPEFLYLVLPHVRTNIGIPVYEWVK